MKKLLLVMFLYGQFGFGQNCPPYQPPCTASIPKSNLPFITPQQNMLWCWVSSTQAIFRYYGYEVDQNRIATETMGGPYITSANAMMMIKMLNRRYIDNYGRKFTVRTPKIYDGFSWLSADPYFMGNLGASVLTNNDIKNALISGRPLMLGTTNHAMVLTSLAYYETNGFVNPVSGWALDPWPSNYNPQVATGLRLLSPNEMTALFAADIKITRGW
jgi:hypothetical protein